jgi:hypothetical protein
MDKLQSFYTNSNCINNYTIDHGNSNECAEELYRIIIAIGLLNLELLGEGDFILLLKNIFRNKYNPLPNHIYKKFIAYIIMHKIGKIPQTETTILSYLFNRINEDAVLGEIKIYNKDIRQQLKELLDQSDNTHLPNNRIHATTMMAILE